MKDDIIQEIMKIEWEMFTTVQNIGGVASCQQDPKTFKIMRESQFASWSHDALKSYMEDLVLAKQNRRNLMTEKYARMMEYTSPSEYVSIASMLPHLNKKKLNLINKIVKNTLEWENDISKKFSSLRAKGRPTHSSDDKQNVTSVETYLRGELATYSFKTLSLYHKNILKQKLNNINAYEIILLNTVKAYGWKSLEEANEKLKS